jgi:DNA-binding NarL/FixJ family response regulator
MKQPRVLLADDHKILLDAFVKLLEPECKVVGTVEDGRSLLEKAPQLRPDVVVVDIVMPRLNGLEAGRQLKKQMPGVKVIFLTMNEDPDLVKEAFRAGASGFLLKSSAASELFQAIKEVCRGRAYVTPLMARGMVESFIRDPEGKELTRKLTPRQREVLQLLAEGHSMKEVAAALDVSPRTVAFHKYKIMEQLQIKSNAELIQYAIKQGVISI